MSLPCRVRFLKVINSCYINYSAGRVQLVADAWHVACPQIGMLAKMGKDGRRAACRKSRILKS